MKVRKKPKVSKIKGAGKCIVVSGGFDPIHIGHVRMIRGAKRIADTLIVLVNNDNWLRAKKGYVFMPQKERVEVIGSIKGVDRVLLTNHKPNPRDMSVCRELKKLFPNYFANGGDRVSKNTPEKALCERIGTKMVFNIGYGGKVQSSSGLVNSAVKALLNIKKKR